jgi:hypothetical protein
LPTTWETIATVLSGEPDASAAFMRAHVQRSALIARERVGQALSRMFEAAQENGSP